MADMALIVTYLIRISVLFVVISILHTKIGSYPSPLPSSANPKKEIWEVFFLWALLFITLSIFIYLLYSVGIFDSIDTYSPKLILLWAAIHTIPGFVVPVLYVRYVNKWNIRKDLGVSTQIQQKSVWYYVILIQILLILGELFIRGTPDPAPVFFLVISLYSTVFLEEFLFRGVIQTKLERALGLHKGWFYGGIVFGLIHIPTNFFGPLWEAGDASILTGFLLLIGQIMNGWWFGITYIKTRSLIPCLILHYMADFLILILAGF